MMPQIVHVEPDHPARRRRARRVAAVATAAMTYVFVALMTVAAYVRSDPIRPVPALSILLALGLLEMLLVLTFLGECHAFWAGVTIQMACLLVAVVHSGPVSWARALSFALVAAILTHCWSATLEGSTDGPSK